MKLGSLLQSILKPCLYHSNTSFRSTWVSQSGEILGSIWKTEYTSKSITKCLFHRLRPDWLNSIEFESDRMYRDKRSLWVLKIRKHQTCNSWTISRIAIVFYNIHKMWSINCPLNLPKFSCLSRHIRSDSNSIELS